MKHWSITCWGEGGGSVTLLGLNTQRQAVSPQPPAKRPRWTNHGNRFIHNLLLLRKWCCGCGAADHLAPLVMQINMDEARFSLVGPSCVYLWFKKSIEDVKWQYLVFSGNDCESNLWNIRISDQRRRASPWSSGFFMHLLMCFRTWETHGVGGMNSPTERATLQWDQ